MEGTGISWLRKLTKAQLSQWCHAHSMNLAAIWGALSYMLNIRYKYWFCSYAPINVVNVLDTVTTLYQHCRPTEGHYTICLTVTRLTDSTVFRPLAFRRLKSLKFCCAKIQVLLQSWWMATAFSGTPHDSYLSAENSMSTGSQFPQLFHASSCMLKYLRTRTIRLILIASTSFYCYSVTPAETTLQLNLFVIISTNGLVSLIYAKLSLIPLPVKVTVKLSRSLERPVQDIIYSCRVGLDSADWWLCWLFLQLYF